MDIALTRDVARSLGRCELTFRDRESIDVDRAIAQHQAYCSRLEALGLEVVRLPADESCPDGCFVEDVAVVLDEVAVVAMPGAPSRRPEVPGVRDVLRRFRRCEEMALPATLDGGDVLQLGRRLFVGRTARTNDAGIAALRAAVAPFAYEVVPVGVSGCLHLKSAVTALGEETLLAIPGAFDLAPFAGCDFVPVPAEEQEAANVLRVRGEVWVAAGFPRTLDRLDGRGYRVVPMDVSEFLKAEAGLTCKSVLFRRGGPG
jgi:dimethylargininase